MDLQKFVNSLLEQIAEVEHEISEQSDKKTEIFLKGNLFILVHLVLEFKKEHQVNLGEYDSVLDADYLARLWETAD